MTQHMNQENVAANKKKSGKKSFYVVGVGASAGGLEAIQELFDFFSNDSNLSFVIIQHLSPDYKSLLAELIAKHTKMIVSEAEDNTLVLPNHIYVIPNKKLMTIAKGRI
jgi:two-component system, chemotaxis family, CheB/CheR fusion protein